MVKSNYIKNPKKFKKTRTILEPAFTDEIVKDELEHYTPQFDYSMMKLNSLKPSKKSILTAAKKSNKFPNYWVQWNTTQAFDLYVLEELYLNTPAGTIVDLISWLIYGRGIKPVLKLKNPRAWGDEQAQLEQIKANEGLLDPLIEIDNSIGDDSDDTIGHEHTLKQKLQGLCKMALTFGKGALIRIADDDEGYFLIPFHPKDMTFNILDEKQRLRAILTPIHDTPYEAKDLIYAEYNAVNPRHNSLYHGMALIHRMIDPARTYRRIVGTDFKLIAKKRWQDNYWAAIAKRDGTKDADNIMKKISKGESIVTEENDPDKDIKIHTIPNKSDSADIIEMKRDCVKDMLQIAGIPEPIFFSEKSANYATLVGLLRSFNETVIPEYRTWFGGIITKQHYMRSFKEKYIGSKNILDKFIVECEFTDINLESRESKVELLEKLNRIYPVLPDAAGEILGIDNFVNMIDLKKLKDIEKKDSKMIRKVSDTESIIE